MNAAEKGLIIAQNQQAIYEKGILDGKKAEYDAFWDVYQANGSRGDYVSAFSYSGWKDANFKPKHLMKPTYAAQMFYLSSIRDLATPLKDLPLDFSRCVGYGNFAQNSQIEHFPPLNFGASSAVNQTMVFHHCLKTRIIDLLTVAEHISYQNWFSECPLLEEIRFDGTIAKNISFKDSPLLSLASVSNIVLHLADFSATDTATTQGEYAHTLTLAKEAWQRLFDDTASWWSVFDEKKWNVVGYSNDQG